MSKSVLLIITGSIAAYKMPDMVRRLRDRGVRVTCVLTQAGAQFVAPLALAAVSGSPVYSDLFSLKDETEMGHIRLAREHDLIAVVPASADFIAKMATGRADDLASAILLAVKVPVIIAPAMNAKMWEHKATQRNVQQLREDEVHIIEPSSGELACGEVGQGRLAEYDQVIETLLQKLDITGSLKGLRALVTSGPTIERIDPVRFLSNRSSGKQGNALASALAESGAVVTLVTGPTQEPLPEGVTIIRVETAQQMLAACTSALPFDIAICCAAVSDWRAKEPWDRKLKKRANDSVPTIELALNPDILQELAGLKSNRPHLVIGFAAETEAVLENTKQKREVKDCDWIIGCDVSGGKTFGEDMTQAVFIDAQTSEDWGRISKQELAKKMVEKIGFFFKQSEETNA